MIPHCLIISVLCSSFVSSIHAQPPLSTISTAGASTTWVNGPSVAGSTTFPDQDGTIGRPILSIGRQDGDLITQLHCGFASNGTADAFLFAVFAYGIVDLSANIKQAQLLWAANRDNPIRENATLELTYNGDLVLKDVDGTKVWSSDTSHMDVAGLSLLDTGNLILLNKDNGTVWQSFDHPTDVLLLGQQMVAGQRLGAASWTTGQFFMDSGSNGHGAFIESRPPQMYFNFDNYGLNAMKLLNGSLMVSGNAGAEYYMPSTPSVQFLRMDSDGHFKLYGWTHDGWTMMFDVTNMYLHDCDYPTFCGNYGICSNGQCSCPTGINDQFSYFKAIDDRQINLGCKEVTLLCCEDSQYHDLLHLANVSYFNYIDANASSMIGTDIQICKKACLANCSCKASLFKYEYNVTHGDCYLLSQVFSLRNMQRNDYHSSAFLKVQTRHKVKKPWTKILVGISIVSSTVAFAVCGCIWYGKRIIYVPKREKDDFDALLEMTFRFTYEDVKSMTDDFHIKLGEGGFGAVFQGALPDGTKVAVKQLDSISQGIKEFVAEVKCVGSIHHFNLVRLIGFCAEKSHKLLVYEYMSNGSLDSWIFNEGGRPALNWQLRQKIILDIAKALQYLHQDCRHKIAHLDVKPQNILLNDKFNAKLSDFGLSRLIDREQSNVITSVRGTLGYLAPEWLGSKITEKVDVYSFGIVILEIVCRRKVLDYSQPEDDIHLLSLLKRKVEEGNLAGIICQHGQEMLLYVEEAVKMIEIAVWCLQADCSRRPSMSMVVRVLEGQSEVEDSLDYTFFTMDDAWALRVSNWHVSAPPQASILSGPR